ncbi:MAG: FAD-binding protein [Chitinophagales bacterium]
MAEIIDLTVSPAEAASEDVVKSICVEKLHLENAETFSIRILKRSIDARKAPVKIQLRVAVYASDEISAQAASLQIPQLQNVRNAPEIGIIGAGPAGLFAALQLIHLGYKPIVIERGKDVRERRRDLAQLNKAQIVNPNSNYCFGEGGAGTYSDGKLYTRSHKRGSIQQILDTFIHFGASPDIAVDAHPHIGTNKLPQIIRAMRQSIVDCGGEVLFNSLVIDFECAGQNIRKIILQNGKKISVNAVILATGHSARDIFRLFQQKKWLIEAKNFALGVRIEHPQAVIDQMQYHCAVRGEYLPPATYKIVRQVAEKGVYSFCMCPGGVIAACATENGEIVTNGWSPSRRNNPFANSGFVTEVSANDTRTFAKEGALSAMAFQAMVEQNAYRSVGDGLKAPAQRMLDFVEGKVSAHLPDCSYYPGIVAVDLREVLTANIYQTLRTALLQLKKFMPAYYTNEAVLVAPESRTSSPVRIPRDAQTLMHVQIGGLFPCGEGAGYAGGIVSAAIDGIRCAEAAIKWLEKV